VHCIGERKASRQRELLFGGTEGTATPSTPENLPLAEPSDAEADAEQEGGGHQNEMHPRNGECYRRGDQAGSKGAYRSLESVGW